MEQGIHILWTGPYSLDQLVDVGRNEDCDFGIYQIYAHHSVYGKTLVYIGKARDQTFSRRISQHEWASGSENDPGQIEVYLGRLSGTATPKLNDWRSAIDRAEKLLIHSHGPAYNTHCVHEPPSQEECGRVRVLNWGACRSLAREVSGLMWTSLGNSLRNQSIYRASNLPD